MPSATRPEAGRCDGHDRPGARGSRTRRAGDGAGRACAVSRQRRGRQRRYRTGRRHAAAAAARPGARHCSREAFAGCCGLRRSQTACCSRASSTSRASAACSIVAIHQIEYSHSPPPAVVNIAVDAARALGHAGAAGFVNALLRRYLAQRESILARVDRSDAARLAHPRWLLRELHKLGDEAAQLAIEANNESPPMTLRVNLSRQTRDAALERARGRRHRRRCGPRPDRAGARGTDGGLAPARICRGRPERAGRRRAVRSRAPRRRLRPARARRLCRARREDRSHPGANAGPGRAGRAGPFRCTPRPRRAEPRSTRPGRDAGRGRPAGSRAGGMAGLSTGSCWTPPARQPA